MHSCWRKIEDSTEAEGTVEREFSIVGFFGFLGFFLVAKKVKNTRSNFCARTLDSASSSIPFSPCVLCDQFDTPPCVLFSHV